MKQNNLSYKFYLARLSSTPIPKLIDLFNKEVGHRGWTSERSAYDAALINAFINKGVDVSAVYDGIKISFKHKVDFDADKKELILLA